MLPEKKILEEYENEKKKLIQNGGLPVGVNSHLESFIAYMEWRKKVDDLFDDRTEAEKLR